MPIRTLQRRITGNQDVSSIRLALAEGVSTQRGTREIEALMRQHRRIAPGEEDDFQVFDMREIGSILGGITAVLTGLLSSVAAVSLLVGGIGIMNIMLVSVTERTREIGIRLAVGAQARQVLQQFLVEAMVLSVLGGVLGIALGLVLAAIASRLMDIPFAPIWEWWRWPSASRRWWASPSATFPPAAPRGWTDRCPAPPIGQGNGRAVARRRII